MVWACLTLLLSIAGILALLAEDDPTLLEYALAQLNTLVNTFWTEISENLSGIETIYEQATLPLQTRQLAALLASKVYYHLGSLDDALTFALSAGELFKVYDAHDGAQDFADQDYTETIIATCIDKYVELRAAREEGLLAPKAGEVDGVSQEDLDKMHSIVEKMFERCIRDREFKQALGIALDSRRLDIIEQIFHETKDPQLLTYILEALMTIVLKLEFRNKVSLSRSKLPIIAIGLLKLFMLHRFSGFSFSSSRPCLLQITLVWCSVMCT